MADMALDAGVRADAELSEGTGAVIRVKHLQEELLVLLRARPHDLAVLELQPRSEHFLALVDLGELGEGDDAVHGVLERRCEDLAGGHVVPAVRVHGMPAPDAESQVCVSADNPYLL